MIAENDLPLDLMFQSEIRKGGKQVDKGLFQARQAFERQYILRALQSCQWNQSKASRLLRVHRNTLLQKIKTFDIHIKNG
jgi:DNA-binding NtrC family response regulator